MACKKHKQIYTLVWKYHGYSTYYEHKRNNKWEQMSISTTDMTFRVKKITQINPYPANVENMVSS